MNISCSAEPCPVILNSTCVYYAGANLIYTGVNTNDNLQTILQKIDAKFEDAGLGYIFQNGLIQTAPGNPVILGGSLNQNTTINSAGFTFALSGTIEASSFITTGGTSSQFVKGDGSLDNTTYQIAGNYITALTGDGTAVGPGSAAFTLANTGVIANTYGSASQVPVITVDAKGRVTNVTNTAISYPAALLLFSGDVTGAGLTGANVTLTLNNVNSGVFPAITPLKFSVNAKGLVTGASALTNLDIFALIGYTPVPQTRTLTINGQTYDLSANRTWTVSGLPSQTGNAGKYLKTDGTVASWQTVDALPPQATHAGQFLTTNGTVASWATIPLPTASALTKVDDTNVTLTLGGSPNTALLAATSLTLGWTGTLADSRITSAATWNAKQDAITLTTTGTSGPATFISNTLNIPQYTDQFTGTVTSVQLSAGTGISLSGTNPITTSGTITVTNSAPDQTVALTAGTGISVSGTYPSFTITNTSPSVGGQVLHGTASGTDTYTVTIAGPTSYADGDAYLIRFTNGNTATSTLNINGIGAITLYRNNDGPLIGGDIWDGAEMLCVYNSTLNVFQCIGTSPNSLFAYVTNDDSVTLIKGMPVYAFSGTGDRMTVKRANNTTDATSAQTVGLVYSTSIGVNQKGIIIIQGLLTGLSILPTSTWSDGDPVYLGSTAGSITKTKPYAPNHLVYLGVVTTASNGSAGRMYVRVQNGYELDELHNVQAQSPALKDTLWYDSTVSPGQWKTASISNILGYTPQVQLNGTGFVKATGTTITYDNSTYVTSNIYTADGTLSGNRTVTLSGNTLDIAGTTSSRFQSNGSLTIGTTTDVPSSILTVDSTSKGFLPPRMTTVQKNAIAAPAQGLIVYDTTSDRLNYRDVNSWEEVATTADLAPISTATLLFNYYNFY